VAAAFITFEGIDGSGKSTQLRLLASELRLRGFDPVVTREPGGTPLGGRLRAALLDSQAEVDPLAELLLYAADRAQHVRTLIRPALAAGHVVLSDRYADATVAYQGAGRGFTPALIEQVINLATEGLKPDLTLIFDISIKDARSRRSRRTVAGGKTEAGDRLDTEDADFYARVREAYKQIARAEPDRVRVINASNSIQETHDRVMEIVMPILRQS
jgi:dTMP kinase